MTKNHACTSWDKKPEKLLKPYNLTTLFDRIFFEGSLVWVLSRWGKLINILKVKESSDGGWKPPPTGTVSFC